MTAQPHNTQTSPSELEAARLLLDRLGVRPEDLLGTPSTRPPAPTFAAYIPVVERGVSAGTLKAYGTYWKRVLATWPERQLDEPSPSELRELVEETKRNAVSRRSSRGGRGAAENMVAALRCLYNHAVDDGLIGKDDNPAAKIKKPRRLPSKREALQPGQVAEINQTAATTGDDPALDCLLLRLHTETACRRGGALALRPIDLDPDQCLIHLWEKGGADWWQPVSPTLMRSLQDHAAERGSPPNGPLLRYANGDRLTYRRYDGLWVRIGQNLPWVAAQQVSTHWLRHTTLTWVDRTFSQAVARRYAGHADGTGSAGSTAIYTGATLAEVATALAALTAEPHPLAVPASGPSPVDLRH